MRILLTGNGDLAKALYKELNQYHDVLIPSRKELDVTSQSSVRDYFSLNSADVVVNLAGTLYSSLIKDSVPELWIKDIEVNLIGTYLVCRYALENNQGVKIVNISSTAAYNSYKDWTSYCASKSGVIKISNGLAIEGYDVVTLCPGAIDTKIRIGLNIVNNNVMSISEGVSPIINAILGNYQSGDIVFYRKNELKIIREI